MADKSERKKCLDNIEDAKEKRRQREEEESNSDYMR
jgi:hypothetical protein